MKFVFQFLFREKLLFITNIFFIFLGTFFLFSQIFIIANVASFTFNIEKAKILAENIIPPNSETPNTLNNLFYLYEIYKREGNLGVTKHLIALKNLSLILKLSLLVLFLTLISQSVLFLKDMVANFLSKKIGIRIRKYFFDQLIYMPIAFFRQKESGDIISRVTNDVKIIEDDLNSFFEYGIFGIIFSLTGFIILIYLNLKFSLILFFFIPIIIYLINYSSKFFKKMTINIQESLAKLTQKYHLTIYGIDIIKIFNQEEYEKKKFERETNYFFKNFKKQIFLDKINRPINEILIIIAVIVIVLYGSTLIWKNEITINTMLTFILVLVYVSQYIQRINYAFFFVKTRIGVASKRLQEVLLSFPQENVFQGQTNINISGEIEFKKINFSYQKKKILENISFKVKPNQFIALVGVSGQGKSTLLSLIPLLIQPESGEILFNNKINHREISLKKIREKIAIVTQENILFTGTVKENITYGRAKEEHEEHNFKEIKKAAQAAYIHDFIMSLENGYDTLIGERGTKLSGGQKQRLCIARAIYKQPRILLLDEATSALDSESEKKIQLALQKNFLGQITTFIVSHRLNIVIKADQIFLLADGKIKERGTPQQLWKKKKNYYHLFKNQIKMMK